jgi:hypothetical protein|tara:strand:+ start:760 stop:1413 length:654 start_codon:yes stop_codon:yes gene_type:complete
MRPVVGSKSNKYPLTKKGVPFPLMPLTITPDVGIPLPFDVTPEEVKDFRKKAKAAFNTIKSLLDAGAQMPELDEGTSTQAHELMAREKLPVAKTPPGVIIKLEALLTHYDHEFLNANDRLANYVTNRLLEETENEDARFRLKALELLGKRRGVNLFSEQHDVTIRQKPTEDIENRLNQILGRYVTDVETVEENTNELLENESDHTSTDYQEESASTK